MATILYLTRTGVADVSSGGKHRAYQVTHDLNAIEVEIMSLPNWWSGQSWVARGLKRRMERWGIDRLRIRLSTENPYNLLAYTPFTARHFVPARFFRDYAKRIRELPKPLVCLLSDTRLAGVLKINTFPYSSSIYKTAAQPFYRTVA